MSVRQVAEQTLLQMLQQQQRPKAPRYGKAQQREQHSGRDVAFEKVEMKEIETSLKHFLCAPQLLNVDNYNRIFVF